MKKFLLVLFCLAATDVLAEVMVVDGDSLIVDGREIRLEGIDAPEYNQYCRDENSKRYKCGRRAESALRAMINGEVRCEKRDVDRYDRELAICYVGDVNLNRKMVADGWAIAYTRYSNDFAEDEAKAKKNKKGIWRGKFMRPEIFRALQREKQKGKR